MLTIVGTTTATTAAARRLIRDASTLQLHHGRWPAPPASGVDGSICLLRLSARRQTTKRVACALPSIFVFVAVPQLHGVR
jgi:hypothetical protein